MRKYLKSFFLIIIMITFLGATGCESETPNNRTAIQEQHLTEENQSRLNSVQPAPQVTYSIERENLINRFKLMNDQGVVFYMYIFNEGVSDPVFKCIVNKVSSVNSQLTNPEQLVFQRDYNGHDYHILPSPAEDGSYGTNGDAVFGFSPEGVYLETNMNYLVSLVPLDLKAPEIQLNISQVNELNALLNKVYKE